MVGSVEESKKDSQERWQRAPGIASTEATTSRRRRTGSLAGYAKNARTPLDALATAEESGDLQIKFFCPYRRLGLFTLLRRGSPAPFVTPRPSLVRQAKRGRI